MMPCLVDGVEVAVSATETARIDTMGAAATLRVESMDEISGTPDEDHGEGRHMCGQFLRRSDGDQGDQHD